MRKFIFHLEIEELIKKSIKGNPKAQRLLMENVGARLHYVCQRYATNGVTSEDILQDSLIQIFQKLELFDSNKGNFYAWTKTITVRIALRLVQQNQKFLYTNIDEVYGDEISFTPRDDISQGELLKIIDALDEPQRTIFNLNCIEGYQHDEIAKMLDIKESTCRSHLRRAKIKLREQIENF